MTERDANAMAVNTDPKPSWADRMQRIDRRILYLILLAVIAIPTIRPVTIPNTVLPMSRDLWETIDQTPPNQIVLISSTWTKNTRGENQGQMQALLNHLMSRRIRFMLSTFDPRGEQVGLNLTQAVAARYNYRYGIDWIAIGYQVNPVAFIKGINVDLVRQVKMDAVEKKRLDAFPVMSGIRSVDDIHMVVEISASSTQDYWVQFIKSGVKIGFCCTSVMAPQALPYYTSHQLAGVLWGAKGAYDYEQLNDMHHTGVWGYGRQYMGPLSAAFLLVIVSIVVGNVAMFVGRSQRRTGGA